MKTKKYLIGQYQNQYNHNYCDVYTNASSQEEAIEIMNQHSIENDDFISETKYNRLPSEVDEIPESDDVWNQVVVI